MHGQSPSDNAARGSAAHGPAKSDWTHVFRAVTDRDPAVRQEAWKRLLQSELRFEELVSFLHHGQPRVREGAARFLPRSLDLERGQAVDLLRDLVHDPNSYVAAAALETLGRLKADEARADVLLSLDDSHPMVLRAAIFALGMIGPADMGERILPFLDAPAPHLRLATIDALAELRFRTAIPRLLDMLQSHAGKVRHKNFEFSEPCQLIRALGLLRAEEAIPLLIDFVRGEIGLRSRALKVLEHFDTPAATLALASILKDVARHPVSPELIAHIVRHLVNVDFRLAGPDMVPLLASQHLDVRRAALRAVHRWQWAEARDAVRDMAQRETSDLVRPEAVRALAALAGPDAWPDLRPFALDPNAWVRRAVAESILSWNEPATDALAVLDTLRDDPALAMLFNASATRPASAAPAHSDPSIPETLRAFIPSLRLALAAWRDNLDPRDLLHQPLSQILHALAETTHNSGLGHSRVE